MKKPLPIVGAAGKPTPPIKVAIFTDAAQDPSVIEVARQDLEYAGYELVKLRTKPGEPVRYAMLFGLKEIDEYLEKLKRQDEDCPDVIVIDLYSMDDQGPGLYQRNIAADRYLGKLVPSGLAEAIRSINACIRVAICSEASPEEDPIVKVFYEGGLAATGRMNPRGPVIFFHKEEWAKEDWRFLRREGRVTKVTLGEDSLRKLKKSLHSFPWLSWLITAIYPWLPFKILWAGDRRWVYELTEQGKQTRLGKRHLLRTTVLVTDYAAVVKELTKIGTFSKKFYNLDLATVAKQARHGGRKLRVLLVDDTPYQRSDLARRGLASCELTVCTSAREAVEFLSKLRLSTTSRDVWPDVVLCDLYMPAYVNKKGELAPKNDLEPTHARLLPMGFAIALVARSLGLRVGICTDLRHHHNDRILGLLGNLSTLSSPMGFVAGGVNVFEVTPGFQVDDGHVYVPGYGISLAKHGSVDDKPKYWRGKILRLQGRFPSWMRAKLGWPSLRDPIYDCYDPKTGKYRTTVLSKDLYSIKDWGKVLETLLRSPIIHPDLQRLPRTILDQFGIKI